MSCGSRHFRDSYSKHWHLSLHIFTPTNYTYCHCNVHCIIHTASGVGVTHFKAGISEIHIQNIGTHHYTYLRQPITHIAIAMHTA